MAVFLFDAELTLKNIIAMVIIIAFAALISIDKPSSDPSDRISYAWVVYSFLAFFLYGLNALAATYLIRQGVSVYVNILYAMIFSTLYGLIDVSKRKTEFKLNWPKLISLIGVGVGATFFYIFMQLGFKTAPNVGYVNIVNTASITALTVASALIFKDELTLRKIIGVLGVTGGLVLIFI